MKEIKRIYCNGTMKVERIDKEYSVCVCNKSGNYEEIDNSLINNKNNIKSSSTSNALITVRLDKDLIVTAGTGTENDPYLVGNNTKK